MGKVQVNSIIHMEIITSSYRKGDFSWKKKEIELILMVLKARNFIKKNVVGKMPNYSFYAIKVKLLNLTANEDYCPCLIIIFLCHECSAANWRNSQCILAEEEF